MNDQQRTLWNEMMEHQQAVTRAAHFWGQDNFDERTGIAFCDLGDVWYHLNEAANMMLRQMVEYSEARKKK